MLESGVEDEHITLINNQTEFGSTIGMMPSLIPYSKWTFLPIPWLRSLQAGRERLKEVRWKPLVLKICKTLINLTSPLDPASNDARRKSATEKDLLGRLIEAKDPVTGQMLIRLT
jgi:hypothetical protein